TPGTLPARRAVRAAPLPTPGRAVAFSSCLAAIISILLKSAGRLQGCGAPGGACYSGIGATMQRGMDARTGLSRPRLPCHFWRAFRLREKIAKDAFSAAFACRRRGARVSSVRLHFVEDSAVRRGECGDPG